MTDFAGIPLREEECSASATRPRMKRVTKRGAPYTRRGWADLADYS